MNNVRNILLAVGNVAAVVMVIAVFVTAMTTAATEQQDDSGMAGLGAALIALSTAVMATIGHGQRHRVINLIHRSGIGASALAGAYLWVAAETMVHPSSWQLPTVLAALVFLVALIAIVVVLTVRYMWEQASSG